MIYTVTLNPALDRFIVVEQLLAEDTTRILSETAYAAGKGINVSRVIRELGGHSVALGLVGGYEGLQLEGLLINAGVMSDFTRISGETRTNIILREQTKAGSLLSVPPARKLMQKKSVCFIRIYPCLKRKKGTASNFGQTKNKGNCSSGGS